MTQRMTQDDSEGEPEGDSAGDSEAGRLTRRGGAFVRGGIRIDVMGDLTAQAGVRVPPAAAASSPAMR